MKRNLVVTALACVALCAISAHASEQQPQAPTAGPRPGPVVINNMGPAGGAYPAQTFGVVMNYIRADKDQWYHGGSGHSAPSFVNPGSEQHTTQNLAVVKFRYGLGNGWDIRTSTPIPYNAFHNSPVTSKHGVGDTLAILHKQFMNQAQGSPLDMAAGVGLWMPTGGTNKNDVGSGAWGVWAEWGANYHFDEGRQVVEAEIGYLYRGDGGNKALNTYGDQSDLFRANARYAYALSRMFDLGLEMQYEHAFDGDGPNDGNAYDTLFAGPSATLKIPSWKATLGVSAQFSLYQDYDAHAVVNGLDYPTPASLGESWRIEAKLTKAFSF